jgi:peptidoglycan/LPS O-acetylase OafA/YrhL
MLPPGEASWTRFAVPIARSGGDALETLRAVAMLLLIGYHASLVHPAAGGSAAEALLTRVGVMGWIGTDLLLALAGFLAIRSRALAGGGVPWLGRRAARVLPSFAVFLIAYLYVLPAILFAVGGHEDALRGLAVARGHQAWLWGMATNIQVALGGRPGGALEPLLTLAIGAQLTVLLAFILSSKRAWAVPAGLAFLEVTALILRVVWIHADVWRTYSLPLTRCDAFVAGAGGAWLLTFPGWDERLRRHRRALAWAAGLGLGVVVLATGGLAIHSPATSLLGYPGVGLFSGVVVAILSQINSPGRWLRLGASAGGAAYAVYLVKLPVIFWIQHRLDAFPSLTGWRSLVVLVVLGALASGIVGGAFYLLVERPAVRGVFAWLRLRAPGRPSAGPSPDSSRATPVPPPPRTS